MAYDIHSINRTGKTLIVFDLDAQNHKDGYFTVPKEVRDLLGGIGDRTEVILGIENPIGVLVYKGRWCLRSGPEIYGSYNGSKMANYVKAGNRIRVHISLP